MSPRALDARAKFIDNGRDVSRRLETTSRHARTNIVISISNSDQRLDIRYAISFKLIKRTDAPRTVERFHVVFALDGVWL